MPLLAITYMKGSDIDLGLFYIGSNRNYYHALRRYIILCSKSITHVLGTDNANCLASTSM